jgi:hypothetical protein
MGDEAVQNKVPEPRHVCNQMMRCKDVIDACGAQTGVVPKHSNLLAALRVDLI